MKNLFMPLIVTIFLSACGGGGGDSDVPSSNSSTDSTTNTTGPVTLPKLQAGDVKYLGYFTLPPEFNAEVRGLGLSSEGTKLYVGQYPSSIGLVIIPELGDEAITEIGVTAVPGSIGGTCDAPVEIAGILAYRGKLVVQKRCYYTTQGETGTTHAVGDLNITNFSVFSRLDNTDYKQYASGWMGNIPVELQPLLGGPAFSGNSLMSILSQNSVGPSFYVFSPIDVGVTDPIPSDPLMLFPYGQEMYNPDVPNDYIVRNDQQNAGMILPSGTSSALFFSRHGTGPVCYGTDCNDPCDPGTQGEHGYPYRRQITAFDVNDLLAVKNGTKNYYDVRPYAWWEAPNAEDGCDGYQYSAIAYDDYSRKVYVATNDFYGTRKIHIYTVAE
jgi:hypothetical protein